MLKINYHVTNKCNFRCRFCFAPTGERELSVESQKEAIKRIARSGRFSGINLAGGEPFLYGHTPELIRFIRSTGLEVSVITNGYLLTDSLLERILPDISVLGISLHSFEEETKVAMGFCTKAKETVSNKRLEEICALVQQWNRHGRSDCKVKINTVVCSSNKGENLVQRMKELPGVERWKLLRCQPHGRNQSMQVSDQEFHGFCQRAMDSRMAEKIVREDDMRDSYVMMNPAGEFIKNTRNGYESVGSPLTDSIPELLELIGLDEAKYRSRYGMEKTA